MDFQEQMEDSKNFTILIVDDNPENIKVLFHLLQQSGFRVSVARSGISALQKVEEIIPHLILLDVMMPGLNGYETCNQLKSNLKTRDIPVIFISALDGTLDKVQAFAAGGVDYITKPFQAEEVLARINTQLALQQARSEIIQINTDLEKRIQQRSVQLQVKNLELEQEINERKHAEQGLLKSEEQFRLTFDRAPIGMAITNLEGQFINVNQALCEMLCISHKKILLNKWVDFVYPDDQPSFQELIDQIYRGKIAEFKIENRYLTKNNQIRYGTLQVTLVNDVNHHPLHLIGQLVDITDRKHAEEQLTFNALHDYLTHLPNRNLLMERLEHALRRVKRDSKYLFALLFIDLDRFKVVNDSLGHQVGDQLLKLIADRLLTIVRATDTVARLGGDEFIILLDPIDEHNDALRIAERISRDISAPFQLESRQVFTTSSIGIAFSSASYSEGTEILRDADIAMYRAKSTGRACYQVFDQVMHEYALGKLHLENDLHQAIERQEFRVYYQPIVSLGTGRISGFEALVRWCHPERGLVGPNEFIPLAEETGLIIPIGAWVLETACRQLTIWQAQYDLSDTFNLSVNLSVKQLKHPGFLEQIEQIIYESKVDPSKLKLELTESMLIDDVDNLIQLLFKLQAKGIKFSIDDFGTGFSSLSYLHRFPVDTLKIDRSFIDKIEEKSDNKKIVEAILALARQLDMTATAEGVETIQQLRQLEALQCEEVQGYFFSPPLELQAAEQFLVNVTDLITQNAA